MQCNIDKKGRVLRFFTGVLAFSVGVVLVALGLVMGWGHWAWITGLVVIAFGLFGIFEARRGWCAVRALGFKTPI